MSFNDLQKVLDERAQQSLYRQRQVMQSPQGAHVKIDGRHVANFSANDYLGLANHTKVIASFKQAADDYGVGGGASHLVNGHSYHHHQLELELAEFTGRSKAVLFCSGYMANLGVINALLGKKDAVFEDKLNHASLLDAGLLSGAKFQRYLHTDVSSLDRKLSKSVADRKLVVTDGVFSMDGNLADLTALSDCAKHHDAWLMVDDAHGLGCLGESGGGSAEVFSLNEQELPVLMGTLGKAFGTAGAFVAGSEALVETLIQFARTYIYTTSLPPAVAAATRTSLELIKSETWRREHLQELIAQFREGCLSLGLELMPSTTPIQPILIGESDKALSISEKLLLKGMLVKAIRPPTVPVSQARLRVTLSAAHSSKDISELLQALETTLEEVSF